MPLTPKNGFSEVKHTADLELKAWGQDLPSLFEQAAQGMYHLMGMAFAKEQPEPIPLTFHIAGIDYEDLLVTFLAELLYLLDEKQLAFTSLNLEISEKALKCQGSGSLIVSRERGIKAATYHNIKILKTKNGLEVNIVFDI